jgi:hypothetical protein
VVEVMLSGIVLGAVLIVVLGLFILAYVQYLRATILLK